MDNKKQNQKADLNYYLTLFKLEGHTTWRAHLGGHPEAFEKQVDNDNWPKITGTKTFVVDRVKGTINLLK